MRWIAALALVLALGPSAARRAHGAPEPGAARSSDAASPGPDRPVGVVRVVRSVEGAPAPELGVGALLRVGDALRSRDAWMELLLGRHARVRVSPGTHARIEGRRALRLERGRVWLEWGSRTATASVDLPILNARLRVAPGTELVVDTSGGGSVTVLEGSARVGQRAVLAGQVLGQERGAVSGGREVRGLVRREARAGVGDLAGWRALVLRRAAAVAPGRPAFVDAEPAPGRGLDAASPADRVLEEAVRPPAFFLDELPGESSALE